LRVIPTGALLALANIATAADLSTPEGLWQPLDSAGHPLGLIRIYQEQGGYFGRIEPSFREDRGADRCVRCNDERKDQPIIGLVIIRNMRREGEEYTGGDVLDPDTGRIYGCKFRLIEAGHKMIMRGYFGISLFGRSLTWRRVEAPP
jgi:uncharacterized protein (DUF2147 family)